MSNNAGNNDDLRCSFCGRDQHQVRRVVAGREPGVYICNYCVELCAELLEVGTEIETVLDDEEKPERALSVDVYETGDPDRLQPHVLVSWA